MRYGRSHFKNIKQKVGWGIELTILYWLGMYSLTLFRDRCRCLILSYQGHMIPQLTEFFNVHRITIYEWFNLWEAGGIEALHKKPDQGHPPKSQIKNQKHIAAVKKAVSEERQCLKQTVVNWKSKCIPTSSKAF